MPPRSPTMKDIAAASGYARATVSLALRNSHSLPASTRKHILATAERLGYRSNPLVSALMVSLRTKRPIARHTVLALVTTHRPDDPWKRQRTFSEMVVGARTRAVELGYRLEELSLRAPGMTSPRFRQMLRARNIHGLLINPLPHDERSLDLDVTDFAVIGLGPSVAAPTIDCVSNDHFQSAVLACTRCRELGYRRIGLALSREMNKRLRERWLGGYLLAQHRLPRSECPRPLMPAATADIPAMLRKWCEDERPDVVLFGYYESGYLQLLPRQVGVVALSVYDPAGALTGIYQNSPAVGATAVDYLVGRLQRNQFGADPMARLHLMAGEWTPGRTAPGPGRLRPVGSGALG